MTCDRRSDTPLSPSLDVAPSFSRRAAMIGGLGAAAAIASGLGSTEVGHAAATGARPFADSAPINRPIPASPVLAHNSRAVAAAMGSGAKVLDVIAYGVPIVRATRRTRRWKIVPTESWEGGSDWGPNQLRGYSVPINMNWRPTPMSGDGVLVVIDGDRLFEFYRLDLSGSRPRCAWATTTTLTNAHIHPGPTGANISRTAGVIRYREWQAGVINHALVFSSDMVHPSIWKAPATKTDGRNLSGSPVTIPEGTRIQLDPRIDVDAQPWRRYTKIVAKALQKYGAFCVDNGGARVALIAQRPLDGRVNHRAFASVGITKDYAGLELDWTRIRVLRNMYGT